MKGKVYFGKQKHLQRIYLRCFVLAVSLYYTHFSGFWTVFSSTIKPNSHKSGSINHVLGKVNMWLINLLVIIFFRTK